MFVALSQLFCNMGPLLNASKLGERAQSPPHPHLTGTDPQTPVQCLSAQSPIANPNSRSASGRRTQPQGHKSLPHDVSNNRPSTMVNWHSRL